MEKKVIFNRDGLASFLFELMRDHLPQGHVEGIVRNLEAEGARTVCFSAPAHHLGAYAIELAARIRACDAGELDKNTDEALMPHVRLRKEPQ